MEGTVTISLKDFEILKQREMMLVFLETNLKNKILSAKQEKNQAIITLKKDSLKKIITALIDLDENYSWVNQDFHKEEIILEIID